MDGFQILAIIILVLIVVPLPLVWVIGTIFPNGVTRKHARQIREYAAREWKRIAACGVVIVMMFIFAPDYALQVTLLGAAILVGRYFAVRRRG